MQRTALALALSLPWLGGCGDDNGDQLFTSDLDEDRTAASLDDQERDEFCKTLDAHVNITIGLEEVARVTCLPLALVTATSREACEELLDSCSRDAPRIALQMQQREQQCYDSLASCEQSVGDLETCANVNISALRTLLERLTCARFGDEDLQREYERVMDTAAACGRASASCEQAVLLI